jgi:hypothetical protein
MKGLVPRAGVEPARPYGQRILSPVEGIVPDLTKRDEPIFIGLAAVKVTLRPVTSRDKMSSSSRHRVPRPPSHLGCLYSCSALPRSLEFPGNLANTRAAWTTPSEHGLLQARVSGSKDEFLTNRLLRVRLQDYCEDGQRRVVVARRIASCNRD